jgi:hypothetical protein
MSAMNHYESWGRGPGTAHAAVLRPFWRTDDIDFGTAHNTVLPFGRGRSYGDVCLNEGGTLIDTRELHRFISFDGVRGVVRCEAGITFADLLAHIVPRGWFLPVVPGTKFVTVGGAIANDIHGKNHHTAGTFGRYVRRFELLRSDGERLLYIDPHEAGTVVEIYHDFDRTIGATITWERADVNGIEAAMETDDGTSLSLRARLGTSVETRVLDGEPWIPGETAPAVSHRFRVLVEREQSSLLAEAGEYPSAVSPTSVGAIDVPTVRNESQSLEHFLHQHWLMIGHCVGIPLPGGCYDIARSSAMAPMGSCGTLLLTTRSSAACYRDSDSSS